MQNAGSVSIQVNRRTIAISIGAIALLVLPVAARLVEEPYLVSLFSRILIYALAAVSLDLMLGFGGMVSLGHAAFVGIGAYVIAILSLHGFEGTPVFINQAFSLREATNAIKGGIEQLA